MMLKSETLLTLLTLLNQQLNRVNPHSEGVEVLRLLSLLRRHSTPQHPLTGSLRCGLGIYRAPHIAAPWSAAR